MANNLSSHQNSIGSARSFLFVPGDRPEKFEKAMAAGADQVIIDLEDSVSPEHKVTARAAIAAMVSPDRPVLVRINSFGTPYFSDDVALCAKDGITGVVVSKAESSEDLGLIYHVAPQLAILPLIETAKGLAALEKLAMLSNVSRLVFGSIDLQHDLGIPEDGLPLAVFRSQLVLASRLAGLAPPVDGVTVSFNDSAVLEADVISSRRFGFGGKLAIHPKQVGPINAGFAPTREEEIWATKIIAASRETANSGRGAIVVDGNMVDRPVLLRAENILRAR